MTSVPTFQRRLPELEPYAKTSNPARARRAEGVTGHPAGFVHAQRREGISVIILNKDKPEYICPLLESLVRQKRACGAAGIAVEILVGDTGSTSPQVWSTYEALAAEVTVVRDLKYHFSRCNNRVAFGASTCSQLLFLNNDIILPEGVDVLGTLWRRMVEKPELGAQGVCLWFPDGTIQHAGMDFFREPEVRGLSFHPHARERHDPAVFPSPGKLGAVTGAFLHMPSHLYGKVGGMLEDYGAECQDVDLCLAVRRLGYEIECINVGHVIHIENGTRPKGEENWADRRLFLRRWNAFLEATIL
jgi:GT2 family glycosyltransferase